MIGRATLGWIAAVAALALVAPSVSATPESDAGAAIDAAWTAAGAEGSVLGAKDGGVYAAGSGFGQNFAGGAIYFSPDTGARIMFGAILDRYRSLGGPADGDLGFPTIDEGPGRAPQSRNSTFSAADKPVIFWTPDTGAWVVRGAINAAWDRLGGSTGVLGVPVSDESFDGDVVSQKFSGGQITFDARTKTFTTEPADLAAQLADVVIPGDAGSAINTAFRASGGSAGPLGARQGDQFTIPPDGVGQAFAGGKIFYSPATGAHAVSGAILEKYESVGGPTGDLGLPNAAESDGGVPDSRVSSFAAEDKPVIFWTQDHGAVVVRGAMKAAWDKLGGASGALGVPESDQSTAGDKTTQQFSGGTLSWDAKSNTFTSDPANLADALGGLEVPTQAPATPAAPNPPKDSAFSFHTWWLWWIIPLALLLLASLYALMSGRRRRTVTTPGGDLGGEDLAPEDRQRWTPAETDEPARPATRWREADAVDPQPRWAVPGEPDVAGDHELFTHHVIHEAQQDQNAHDDDTRDEDSVDTAPTRVQTELGDDYAGRHAALEPPNWGAADEDPYVPGPGSLFAPVYGAAPPPDQPSGDTGETIVSEDFGDHGEPSPLVEVPDAAEADAEPESSERDYEAQPAFDEPYEQHAVPPAIHLPLEDPNRAPEGYPVKGRMSTGTYHTPDSPFYDDVVAEIWFTDAQHAEANGFTRSN